MPSADQFIFYALGASILVHAVLLAIQFRVFDPARLIDAFTDRLHGTGAVPGHLFGLDLSDGDRQDLLTYLHTL